MLNRKLTAKEAFDRNLLTDVIPDEIFAQEISKKLKEFSKLPKLVSIFIDIEISMNIITCIFLPFLKVTFDKYTVDTLA